MMVTDYDTREKNAISSVWPNCLQVLCRFHVWQAWINKMNAIGLSNSQEVRDFLHRYIELYLCINVEVVCSFSDDVIEQYEECLQLWANDTKLPQFLEYFRSTYLKYTFGAPI